MLHLRIGFAMLVVIGCSKKPPPTVAWCNHYVAALRIQLDANIHAMTLNQANVDHAREELRGLVGSNPANELASDVCSDAHDIREARSMRIIDAQLQLATEVNLHGGAMAPIADANLEQLKKRADELVRAFSDPPAPR